MRSFLENERVVRIANGAVAGHGDTVTTDTLDTAGFDSVTIIAAIGAVDPTGTILMTVQQGAQSGGGDAADLEGATAAATTVPVSAKLTLRPTNRPNQTAHQTIAAALNQCNPMAGR